jgi:folate-dependent phosphoribosylglycinamide formyltransferase PurN
MTASTPCVVLLAGDGASTRIVYHALRARLSPTVRREVIVERPVSRGALARRRVRRLGVGPVVGQVLFTAAAVPLIRRAARRRVAAILAEHALVDAPLPETTYRVATANSAEARDLLRSLAPAVVVVNGTRILDRATLGSTPAPFVNMHAGITPAYRGVHGGYWALADGRPDLVGTTVHRVDEGIDTGAIIEQVHFAVTGEDSFWTYPYLHTAAGIPALVRAVEAALAGALPSRRADPTLPSALRHHPTLWGYVRARLRAGVR